MILAERNHVEIYKKLSPAVVGLACSGTFPLLGRESTFTGTGVVISPDGLILTSATVAPKDAHDIKVYFTDGRVRNATLKHFDQASEGVLLKVEATGLTSMRVADSAGCQAGDPVYSWGNPYLTIEKDGVVSLSAGTISGLYSLSSVDVESRYLGPVIETDAAINPGSDGGPLTDAEGSLIGIQSLAFSKTRWLGISIPTRRLMDAMPELAALKPVRPAPLSGELARAWAPQKALAEAASAAGKATVAIRVMREDETEEPPADRGAEVLKPEKPIPNDDLRAAFESSRPSRGSASGFIVRPEGIIVTAAFNVSDSTETNAKDEAAPAPPETPRPPAPFPRRPRRAKPPDKPAKIAKIFVYLPDGSRSEATLLGMDVFSDLAVLKLAAPAGKTFPHVELAPAADLKQGSYIAVLGRSEAPGGVTINSGRVSARGRFEQTCCEISPLINFGNLGGPVIDLQGRVVGMATHLGEKTPWRQNCGVGFMLQGEQIQKALPDLLAGRTLSRPKRAFLGVQGDMAAQDVTGVRLVQVVPRSAADKAGLRKGDIILDIDGAPVHDWLGLLSVMHSARPGQTVKIKIRRGAQEMTLPVELGEN